MTSYTCLQRIITVLIIGFVNFGTNAITMGEKEGINIKDELLPQSRCGISNVARNRIIGGQPAELGAWPWTVVLGYLDLKHPNRTSWYCGGTLISRRHVLTSAVCVINRSNIKLTHIRLGELDLNDTIDDGASPVDVEIERAIAHPNFSIKQKANDIALLILKKNVSFEEYIQPICLPITSEMKNTNLSTTLLFSAGWGGTENGYTDSPNTVLMEVQVPVISTAKCKQIFLQTIQTDDTMLCTGYPEGGKDTCTGDGGGPLMFPKGKQYYLMGINSFGPSHCGKAGVPSVYTNVPSFIDWIVEKVNEN